MLSMARCNALSSRVILRPKTVLLRSSDGRACEWTCCHGLREERELVSRASPGTASILTTRRAL